ncbi:hypothetical protein [Brucella intermedia]|uniref:hypothetical protein n=1 Tax=Brucella intermedia TaxID=94625 RepID=UPI00128C9373|nr:hypothetical protein [Brucella intermedia]
MKLNAVPYDENLIIIFRADECFNAQTRHIIEMRPATSSEYLYEVDTERFYISNQKRIDDEIKHFGHAFFPLASYEANEKSRRKTIKKVLDEFGIV